MSQRIPWIDCLKAIGIFFVVFAHCPIPEEVSKVVFAFHMPLFFFASGLTFASSAKLPFVDVLKKKANTLIVPYFFFAFFTFLFWFFIGRHFGKDALAAVSPIRLLIGIFYSAHPNEWMLFNVPLWFLTCLFLVEILFWKLQKIKPFLMWVFVVFLAICGFVYSYLIFNCGMPRFPWSADFTLIAVGFLALGYYLKPWLCGLSLKKSAIVILPASLACVVFALLNNRIDTSSDYCGNPILFYASALSGIVAIYGISRLIPQNKMIDFYGKNTLIVFALHMLVAKLFKGALAILLHIDVEIFDNAIILNLALTAVVFIAMIPIIFFLRRFMPRCIGLKKNG